MDLTKACGYQLLACGAHLAILLVLICELLFIMVRMAVEVLRCVPVIVEYGVYTFAAFIGVLLLMNAVGSVF
jgi:hypothetical protein